MAMPVRKHLPRSPRWTEVEEKVAADILARGGKCAEVAAVLQRDVREVHAWLFHLREKYCYLVPDHVLFSKILGYQVTNLSQERALRDFRPMLTVNIETGSVTLDRIKEALGYDYSKE